MFVFYFVVCLFMQHSTVQYLYCAMYIHTMCVLQFILRLLHTVYAVGYTVQYEFLYKHYIVLYACMYIQYFQIAHKDCAQRCAEYTVGMRMTLCGAKIDEYQPRSILYRLKSIEYRLRSIEYRLRSIEYRLKSIFYRPRSIEYRLRSIVYRLRSIDYRSKSIFYRFKSIQYRSQSIVYRLKSI